MNAATLFSGIGAPEVAIPHWNWAWHAEIEKFPSAVMAARHPGSVNLGDVSAHDFTERAAAVARPNVLVFGSPCQSFSVAGKRLGLDDPRGNLALVALRIVARLKPDWFVFENVPGLMSSDGGRDFGAFIGLVDELGYSLAWCRLDAQYRGVAQRRERVFAVGHLGDWRYPAAVLFEPQSLCGDHPPRRQAGERTAGTTGQRLAECIDGQNAAGIGDICGTIQGEGAKRQNRGFMVAHALRADGFDASEDGTGRGTPLVTHTLQQHRAGSVTEDGTGRGVPIIPIDMRQASRGDKMTNNRPEGSSGGAPGVGIGEAGDPSPTIASSHVPAIAFSSKDFGADAMDDLAPTLRAGTHDKSHANAGVPPAVTVALRGREGGGVAEMGGEQATALRASQGGGDKPHVLTSAVRRLTPRECERLQGFPDDYTLIEYRKKSAADGPRYKALGNSMAVPVIRWILNRIEVFERDVRPGLSEAAE